MAIESNQLKNNNYQLHDDGIAPIVIQPNGVVVTEAVQEKSTANVGLSIETTQLSNKNQ